MKQFILLGLVLPFVAGDYTFHGFNVGRTYATPIKDEGAAPPPPSYPVDPHVAQATHAAHTVHPTPHAPDHIVPSSHPPVCTTEYTTVYKTVCEVVEDEKCGDEKKTKYHTEYATECTTVYKKECHPTTRTVPDKKCETNYEKVCTKNTEKTYDVSYEEKCREVVEKICEPASPSYPSPGYGYNPYGRRYGNYRRYGRSAEPSTYGSNCHEVKKPVCEKVPIKVPRYIEVPKCSDVPRVVCQDTVRNVPDTECKDIPEEKCAQVPKQVAHDVAVRKCETVPVEKCSKVPQKVPKKVCKQYKH